MNIIEIRYRTWLKGLPPQPIKLKIPGWAGIDHNHGNGAAPQPWHCPPFVEGSTYGLELLYPFDTECRVVNDNGNIKFEGDFSKEATNEGMRWPPFDVFAPGHYGFTSSLDIIGPQDYIIRVESHPKYYTDETWTTPCVVPGHIQTEWWPRIFFIVFKSPPPGTFHVFKKHQPYGQILVLPKKISYEIYPMDREEAMERSKLDGMIMKNDKQLAENKWIDNAGHHFNDKYKVLARQYNKGGTEAVKDFIEEVAKKEKPSINRSRIKRILLSKEKNESISNQETTKQETNIHSGNEGNSQETKVPPETSSTDNQTA